jgi:hypothetical protein
MGIKEDFAALLEKLKTERDEINLKIHLASMDAREEFEETEKKWRQLQVKVADIADEARESSDEYIDKAKIIGDELKTAYRNITKRLSK